MSYTPTNWQTGDVITAEKLNNIENGIASIMPEIFEFESDYDDATGDYRLSATWQEIHDAFNQGCFVRFIYSSDDPGLLAAGMSNAISVQNESETYTVIVEWAMANMGASYVTDRYSTNDPNSNPVLVPNAD